VPLTVLILTVLIAPKAPILAQDWVLDAGNANLTAASDLGPVNPSNSANNLSAGEQIKARVQTLMQKAQNRLEQIFSEASKSAKETAKTEARRQANQRIQELKNMVTDTTNRAVIMIKNKISIIFLEIKNIFSK
jgi:ElaB/YqjD/DUF883 family membrane-anchored ribosome-binding protein